MPAQAGLFARSAGVARLIYNTALEQRNVAYYQHGVRLGYTAQANELPALKKLPGYEFLGEVHSDVSQQALRDLDRAFSNFFAGRASYPRFKKKGRSRESFRLQRHKTGEDRYDIEVRRLSRHWGELKVPKAGWVRFRWSRSFHGQIKNITISRDPLGWHASVCYEDGTDPAPTRQTGPVVGIDAGVAHAFTTSSGEFHDLPQATRGEQERRVRLARKLARQAKGSNRRERTKRQLAKLRAREARRRHDALHKLTTRLVTDHAVICIEDLQIQNMTRSAKGTIEQPGTNVAQKAGLNRAILAQGWGLFRQQLTYKTQWHGVTLVTVDPKHTSQSCHACGHIARENRENQAAFSCVKCAHENHADTNAALNILDRGLNQLPGAGHALAAQGALPHQQGKELRTTGQTPNNG